MPQRFDHAEQSVIREKLRTGARDAFARKGVSRTTIDELAAAAQIGKGTFYHFYPSKQLLFFELLESFQNDLRAPLISSDYKMGQTDRNRLESLLRNMFERIAIEPMINILGNPKDFGSIVRKIPPERLRTHQKADQEFLDALIAKWSTKAVPPEREEVAAQMTLLILICLRRDFLGESQFPHAVNTALKGLADCFFD